MGDRVYGEKISIDYNSTLDFFEHRGEGKALETKYNYVLFQDDCPEVAVQRDKKEKERIGKILSWNNGERVLDIGCGIGRWGETVLEKGLKYVGIDYSKKLLEIAARNLGNDEGCRLLLGSFQEFKKVLDENAVKTPFDKIFVNGVMMYINDGDLEKGLQDILSVCGGDCEIYFKESMACEKRLTLKEFYSDSLTQKYTVIYRSIAEYKALIDKYFLGNGFSVIAEGALFEEELQNRKETLDYFLVIKKIN